MCANYFNSELSINSGRPNAPPSSCDQRRHTEAYVHNPYGPLLVHSGLEQQQHQPGAAVVNAPVVSTSVPRLSRCHSCPAMLPLPPAISVSPSSSPLLCHNNVAAAQNLLEGRRGPTTFVQSMRSSSPGASSQHSVNEHDLFSSSRQSVVGGNGSSRNSPFLGATEVARCLHYNTPPQPSSVQLSPCLSPMEPCNWGTTTTCLDFTCTIPALSIPHTAMSMCPSTPDLSSRASCTSTPQCTSRSSVHLSVAETIQRKAEAVRLVVNQLQYAPFNAHQGNVPVDTIQQALECTPDRKEWSITVLGPSRKRWVELIESHPDVFCLTRRHDEKWQVRLCSHTNWREGDEQKKQSRKRKEYHWINCLYFFLCGRPPPNGGRVSEFVQQYRTLFPNQQLLFTGQAIPDPPPNGNLLRLIRQRADLFTIMDVIKSIDKNDVVLKLRFT